MFYEIVERLCKKANISPTSFVENNLKMSRSNVTKWREGKVPKSDTLDKIATYFNVSTDYLLGKTTIPKLTYPPNIYPAETNFVDIPMFGNVSAGLGCYANNEITSYEPWSASSIKAGHEYICLLIDGDSMYPTLIENDMILVKRQSSVDSGSFAVLTVDCDEGIVKKVVYGDDWIELHSTNPMYPVRKFKGAEGQRIRVVGLVVESKRKF